MLSLRGAIERLVKAEYDATEAAAPLGTISKTASQSEIRKLKKKERQTLRGKASIFAGSVARKESRQKDSRNERATTTDEFATDANATVVLTRVRAVDRRMAEENQNQKDGRPKQTQRRFGFLLRRNRGN